MFTDPIPEGRIRVTFRGFVISHVDERLCWATMGALAPSTRTSRCHQPRIHVYKTNSQSGETIEICSGLDLHRDFAVVTHKSSPKSIQKFWGNPNPIFHRFDSHNHPKDFRWSVNLNEVHGLTGISPSEISIKPDTQAPLFKMDDGIFHTSDRSDADARRRVIGATTDDAYGKFSRQITARVDLRPGDTAEFTYGDGANIFTAHSSDVDHFVYDIDFDCRCLINEDQSDFGLVYEVIEVPWGIDRVDLVPDLPPGERAISPEVYCGGGSYP